PGPGETDRELVGMAARVSDLDGLAQGARAGVGQGGDRQADLRGQPAIFERFQLRPEAGPLARGPVAARSGALPLSPPRREPHDASPFGSRSAVEWKRHRRRRADRAPGPGRAGEGSACGETSPAAFVSSWGDFPDRAAAVGAPGTTVVVQV